MTMSVGPLVVVVGIIVLAVVSMAALVVVLVRQAQGPQQRGPIAAPGQAEHRAAAYRLVTELDHAVTRAGTTLDFARLQLTSTTPDELAEALTEARASSGDLSTTLAQTGGAPAHGPAGTEAAGRLDGALRRAEAAARRLADVEAQVQRETREIPPPPGV